MRLFKGTKQSKVKSTLKILIFCCMVVLVVAGVSRAYSYTESEQKQVTLEAVRKAVVNCYAIEGSYPANIEYIEQHYGVVIDHNRYEVFYDVFAPNVFPSFDVTEKGNYTINY